MLKVVINLTTKCLQTNVVMNVINKKKLYIYNKFIDYILVVFRNLHILKKMQFYWQIHV